MRAREMTQVGQLHLREDQMHSIIAPILTVASLGSHVTQVVETVKRYEEFQRHLQSRGFGNSQ
jgi:hypothetical protein